MYSIVFSASAEEDFSNFPKRYQKLIRARINRLAIDPRPHRVKKLHEGEQFYRVRQGPYRIVYKIDDIRQSLRLKK
ncbi:MAG: type II toxin-antitoxin system RelE family toxin [Desulfomonilaceae bacterium]